MPNGWTYLYGLSCSTSGSCTGVNYDDSNKSAYVFVDEPPVQGDAGSFGSTGGQALGAPIVGMAASPNEKGYWLVDADGRIYPFGDAEFCGSTGGQPLSKPVVGMSMTSDGGGFWEVASDGGIFAF